MLNALSVLAQTMPGIPPVCGWLALVGFTLLGITAAIDMRTGRVPDVLILNGLLLVTGLEGFFVDWTYAGQHLAMAMGSGFLLYLINELWYRFMKRDAFGMGNSKWTMLAVSTFGPLAGLLAWVLGAWLAIGWMGIMRLRHKSIAHVHFAPFLFIGLLAGIYWLRLDSLYFFSILLKGGM